MIGGFGIGVTTKLRDNRKLLRKKRMFKKERTFLGFKPTHKNDEQLTVDLIINTEAIKKERKKSISRYRKKMIIGVSAIMLSFIFTGVLLVVSSKLTVEPLLINAAVIPPESVIPESYKQFLEVGTKLRQSKDFTLAENEFKKALLINDLFVDAHLELLKTYTEQCELLNEKCEEAVLKKAFLKKEYPDMSLRSFD